jgi:hypothetical protein
MNHREIPNVLFNVILNGDSIIINDEEVSDNFSIIDNVISYHYNQLREDETLYVVFSVCAAAIIDQIVPKFTLELTENEKVIIFYFDSCDEPFGCILNNRIININFQNYIYNSEIKHNNDNLKIYITNFAIRPNIWEYYFRNLKQNIIFVKDFRLQFIVIDSCSYEQKCFDWEIKEFVNFFNDIDDCKIKILYISLVTTKLKLFYGKILNDRFFFNFYSSQFGITGNYNTDNHECYYDGQQKSTCILQQISIDDLKKNNIFLLKKIKDLYRIKEIVGGKYVKYLKKNLKLLHY